MRTKLITAPTVEPVTLAEVKAQLAISDDLRDDVLERRIKEARLFAENFTERSFNTKVLEVALDAFADKIVLPGSPVQSIDQVKYYDSDSVDQTLDSATYTLDDYGDIHYMRLAAGKDWPTPYSISNTVRIQYTAGYGLADDVPEVLKEAIMLTVGHWTRYQASAESGVSITRVPFAVENLLNQYRIYYR